MTDNTLQEFVDIPETELKTILAWIQSEQARTINRDRTYTSNRGTKVDWLTEVRDNLSRLKGYAETDNREIKSRNYGIERRMEREAQEAAELANHEGCIFIKCYNKRPF